MKNLNKLIWALAILLIAFTACTDEVDDDAGDKVSKITITVKDLTATSAVVSFPVLEDSHNYTVNLYNGDGNYVDFDFFSTGMFPGDEVVDGVATLDPFTDLSASTEYKVVVKGTKNIYQEGIVTVALDSVMFTTLAQ